MATDGSIIIDVGLGTKKLASDMGGAVSKAKQFAASFGKAIASSSGNSKAIDQLTQKYARQTETIAKQESAIQKLEDKRAAQAAKSAADIEKQEALVERLNSKIEAAGGKEASYTPEYFETEQQLKRLEDQYVRLESARKKALGADNDNAAQQLEQQMAAIYDRAEPLRQKLQEIQFAPSDDPKVQKLQADLDAATAKLDQLRQASVNAGASLDRDLGLGADKLQRLKDEAASTKSKLSELSDQPSATSSAFERLTGTVRSFGGALKNAISMGLSAGGKLIKALGGIGGKLKSLFKDTKKASGGFDRLRKRMLNLALAALVFNQIRKALRELTNYLGNAMRTNQQFVNSLASIKGNLLTAFQPIFEAVMPALNALMSALARITAYIAAFVNLLFGKSVKASQDSAKALYGQTKALQGTGKAAKEAAGALAAFDEINVLQTKNAEDAAGAGGGEIAPDFGYDFFEMEKWFDQFSNWPDRAYAIGKAIADAIATTLGNIDWERIKEDARIAGQSLAEFIGAFAEHREMWFQIGRTVGEALNTVAVFLEAFADRMTEKGYWKKLGSGMALGLNTAIAVWNPEQAGRAIYKNLNGIMEVIYTFFTETRWDELGRKLAVGLNTIFTGLNWDGLGRTFGAGWNSLVQTIGNFVSTFNWRGLGSGIATAVNGWFDEVKWDDVGETVSDSVIGALNTVSSAIQGTDWSNIGTSIVEIFEGLDLKGINTALWETIGSALGGLATLVVSIGQDVGDGFLEGVAGVFKNIGRWIVDTIFTPFIDGFNKTFEIHSPSKVMEEKGRFLVEGLANGIRDTIQSVVQIFTDTWEDIKTKATESWKGIQDIWLAVDGWFDTNVVGPLGEKFSDFWENTKNIFSNIKSDVEEIFGSMVDSILGWIDSMIKKLGELIGSIFRAKREGGSGKAGRDSSFSFERSVSPFSDSVSAFNIPTLNVPNIPVPAIATGTVMPPTAAFSAGGNGGGNGVRAGVSMEEVDSKINIALSGIANDIAAALADVIAPLIKPCAN